MNAECNKETPFIKTNLKHVDRIAGEHKLTRHDILGRSRYAPVVRARRACVAYFMEYGMDAGLIGLIVNRERTTVLYLAGMIKKSKVANKP
jgi:chromosomal replication initiation ATPase DnaA